MCTLNISYDIRRKASEAAAEVRSETQLDHVLFHQCKRVVDWLRLPICDSLIGCVWNLPIHNIEIPAGLVSCLHCVHTALSTSVHNMTGEVCIWSLLALKGWKQLGGPLIKLSWNFLINNLFLPMKTTESVWDNTRRMYELIRFSWNFWSTTCVLFSSHQLIHFLLQYMNWSSSCEILTNNLFIPIGLYHG